jgi:cell fate regulator YaaT (PSP1 superfamily)
MEMETETSIAIYLVRMGLSGEAIPIHASAAELHRGDRVVCRTPRGLEIGTVLCHSSTDDLSEVGRFLRPADANDEWLWDKLQALSREAAEMCERHLRENGLADVLLEVEPLLDGRTLFFHFLGDPSPSASDRIAELAEVYRQSVSASPFAQRVEVGCGPGCGTESKSGCGSSGGGSSGGGSSGGCSACAVANKCRK